MVFHIDCQVADVVELLDSDHSFTIQIDQHNEEEDCSQRIDEAATQVLSALELGPSLRLLSSPITIVTPSPFSILLLGCSFLSFSLPVPLITLLFSC